MSSTLQYAWHHDAKTGTHRRHMHGMEIIHAEQSENDGTWSMFTGLTVAQTTTPTASADKDEDGLPKTLRDAWKRLRHEAPILSTTTAVSDMNGLSQFEFVYSSPKGDGEVENWLEETFHVQSTKQCTREEALQNTAAQRDKLVAGKGHYTGNLYVYPASEKKDSFHVFLACPHSVTDVRGSYAALHRLFELAVDGNTAQPKWGSEMEHLYPPMVYAAGLRADGDEPPFDIPKLLQARGAEQAQFMPSCELACKSDSKSFQAGPFPILNSLVVSSETHATITQLGKEKGTSVTGIIAAVLEILCLKYNVVKDPKSATVWGVTTDRRARMPKEYLPYYGQCIWSKHVQTSQMEVIQKALDGMMGEQKVTEEFWKLCRDFKEDVDAFTKEDISLSISNDLISVLRKMGAPPPPAQCFYSSFGKIDNILQHSYGSLKVEDPSSMTLTHNLALIAIFSSSWEGGLRINMQYSQLFHEQKDMDAFYSDLAKCMDVLASA